MKQIIAYLKDYHRHADRQALYGTTAFVTLLIFLNYYFHLYQYLYSPEFFFQRFTGFFLLFTFTFSIAYLISFIGKKKSFPRSNLFYLLLILGPAIFAVKISLQINLDPVLPNLATPWKRFWSIILQWPAKGVFTFLAVVFLWNTFSFGRPVAGLTTRHFNARPYFGLLAAMVPLLFLASLTSDFQLVYPKLNNIAFIQEFSVNPWLQKLLFEISYGIDFFTIEFFFRGFLTLAFVRFAGSAAILPMAAFYCTIHFGKPVAECISSFFGGIILGVIVCQTRSIWGGLIVHLGIAWLMELTGWIRI